MKKQYFTLFFLIAAMLIVASFTTASEGIKVGKGTLRIGGNYQGYYAWYEDDNKASEFNTKRARLLLFGDLIEDEISYFVQASGKTDPYLLDSKLIFKHLQHTHIAIGRFVPDYTLFMPKSTAKLELINYPLTTLKTAMWRQTGIQSVTKSSFADFTMGIFNGYQTDPVTEELTGNDWGDDNDAKDFLLRADFKPMDGLKIGLFGWFGTAYNSIMDDDFDANRYGINFEYNQGEWYVAGEYLMATTETAFDDSDVDSAGFFGHLGYRLGDTWELHGRYDHYDPDTDTDNDDESWITAGVNYKILDWNTMFYLNYVMKDDHLGPNREDIDNDEIILMFQYSF